MSTRTSRRRLSAGLLAAATAAAVPLAGAAPAAAQPVPPPSTVIGGKPVPDDTYRFQVALLDTELGDDDRDRQFCGGSLIGPSTVLTAAHCVDSLDDDDTGEALDRIRAVIGRTVLSSRDGVRLTPDFVDVHPEWNSRTSTGPDVAVVHLPREVRIPPVLLATRGSDALERPGRTATVTGWGNTVQQPTGPGDGLVEPANRLRAAQVPIVADDECAAAYSFGDDTLSLDGSEMVCAGRTNADTCQGDSGGPMFIRTPAGHRQIGITSFGYGCGATGFPGVYTQISTPAVHDWITRTTGGPPPQP